MNPIFAIFEGALSPMHLIVVLVVGVLLFGKRLPEIGRSLGKGLVEFKKGLNGLEDEVHGATTPQQQVTADPLRAPQRVTPQNQVPTFHNESTPTQPKA
jgi:sec-independent protein translocase protein TatA